MAKELPARARAVVVGGGIVGASVAYHLTKLGWRDVVLLERRQLTCGTTWHAAGLMGQLRATHALTELQLYGTALLDRLEEETGLSTGFSRRGSLLIACSEGRWAEIRHAALRARSFGVEAALLGPDEVLGKWPLLAPEGLRGGLFFPNDGQLDPSGTTQALAKGARLGGAQVFENLPVTGILVRDGRVAGVETPEGPVAAEVVVNCAGMWARELALAAGVSVPLHAAEHFYLVTEPVAGLDPRLPVLRDPDDCLYVKEDAGKLLFGFFEPRAKPWGEGGRAIPPDFAFEALPEDWDHLAPQLEAAVARVPALGEAGIHTFFNGPESFTPDDRFLLGEAPELPGFFVAAGFNSIGVQSAGGVGLALAEWIVEGRPTRDLAEVDIRRLQPFQSGRRYLDARTREMLGLLYAQHWPQRQPETARPARLSPLHGRLAALGACFGETAGWERANWFAAPGETPAYDYGWGRTNWLARSGEEHRAVREAAGLFDLSSFAKFLIQGPEAAAALERLLPGRVDRPPGRVAYTLLLNDAGGIDADVTLTRLDRERFLLVAPAALQTRVGHWLRRRLSPDERAVATDVTSGYAVIALMGPRAREILAPLTDADLADAAFPFGAAREIDLGYAKAWALRITYVGELGWELYLPSEFAAPAFDLLLEAGGPAGLRPCGFHALNSLRLECGYRHWGHDMGDQDSPEAAGLGFCLARGKGGYPGAAALAAAGPPRHRLASLLLEEPGPLLFGEEPVGCEGRLLGQVTSAAYGHSLGAAVALAQLAELPADGRVTVETLEGPVPARVSLQPFYDPGRSRVRG